MATENSLPVVDAAAPEPIAIQAPTAAAADELKPATKAAKAVPKPRNPASHPSYEEMVKDAIVSLKEKFGSSQYAIQKFLEEKYKTLPATFRKLLLFNLKKFVSAGKIVKVKGSFKLPPARVAAPKPAAVAVTAKPKAKPKPKAAVAAKSKVKAKVVPKTKSVSKGAATKPAKAKVVSKAKPTASTAAKTKAVPAKAKTVAKAKPAAGVKAKVTAPKPKLKERSTKVARTSTITSPGRKAPKPRPALKKLQAKKAVAKASKSPAKKVQIAKKVAPKRGKK